jgi:predicted HicB family RNase H-like nuclease
MSMLQHNGYHGTVETSVEDGVLHGKILFISDTVTYEAETVPQLRQAFFEAVDDYLETCAEVGKSPDKPASGVFQVRMKPEQHQKLILKSVQNGTNLNQEVCCAVDLYLLGGTVEHNHNHNVVLSMKDSEPQSVFASSAGEMVYSSQWRSDEQSTRH